MNLSRFEEPELEFADGKRHVDIRFGLMRHGPLDRGKRRDIRVGLVGTSDTIDGVRRWLAECSNGVPAKHTHLTNLFPPFLGFERTFGIKLLLDNDLCADVDAQCIDRIVEHAAVAAAVDDAVAAFKERCEFLIEKAKPDVLICAPPRKLLDALEEESTPEEDAEPGSDDDEADLENSPLSDDEDAPPIIPRAFHDVLKARCLWPAVPIQMIRPETYLGAKRRRPRGPDDEIRPLQDEATRAWNFHTALYYKAGGTPWRIPRSDAYTSCYVGVAFYKSLDQSRVNTSMAQVFNMRGDGVVVRGGPAYYNKDDRNIHLERDGARSLIENALGMYHQEHKTQPARVVVHKTSPFDQAEIAGCKAAAEKLNVASIDLLSVNKSMTRLYRHAYHPPLRGTMLSLDDENLILYLRGSVPFFRTWPGMYVPRALGVRLDRIEASAALLAEEIFALSKQNWNNTQFDGGWPITVRAAKQVGSILKHVAPGVSTIPGRYSHWM